MIDLYIFDMGGVVSLGTDVSGRIAGLLGLELADIRGLAGAEFAALLRGRITVEEFWRRFSALAGREVEQDLWSLFFRPRPNLPVLELLRGLKGGARVVAGTNTIAPHFRIHEQNGDYEVFDAVYASHRIGLAKPDAAFYEYILAAEGCRAEQAVFVDDLQENVQAARRAGIRGLLYRDPDELGRQLAALEGSP